MDSHQKSKDLLFEKIKLLGIPKKDRTPEEIQRILDIQFKLNLEAKVEILPIETPKEDIDQQTQDALNVFDGEVQ